MLEIKPIQDKNAQKALCELCGAVYNPSALAYSAYDNGAPVGICQFRIIEEHGYMYDLCNTVGVDDLEALIIMGRAALNFIDLCGIHTAYFEGTETRGAIAVGFREKEGKLFADLSGMFESPCKNHKDCG
jgi:hypothetical protein